MPETRSFIYADMEFLGEHHTYPGHPITLAYLIVRTYDSLEAALKRPEPEFPYEHRYPAALADCRIPGAGGNVWSAVDFLVSVCRDGRLFSCAMEMADMNWASCDSQKEKNPERWKKGQEQADRIKPLLRDALRNWKTA